jgi:hypothetical protein
MLYITVMTCYSVADPDPGSLIFLTMAKTKILLLKALEARKNKFASIFHVWILIQDPWWENGQFWILDKTSNGREMKKKNKKGKYTQLKNTVA